MSGFHVKKGNMKYRAAHQTSPPVRQVLIIMKLMFVLLTVASLHVTAGGHAQQVSFSGREVKLENIFKAVEQQTGYYFLYPETTLVTARPVTVNARKMPLLQFLDVIFKEQPLKYSIESRTINVVQLPARVIANRPVLTEQLAPPPPPLIDVKGRVVDEEGKPVAGASVQVKSAATKGVSTNAEGYFELKGMDEKATLIISGVNIETHEVKVSGKTALGDVVVKVKVAEGEEVVLVNTGYQQLPKERATGSFEMVDNKLFNRRVSTDVLSRLEDVVPGLIFNRRYSSGNNISIRGRNTLTGDGQPLIVVDNFPFEGDLSALNPNDIENITVLKDAAAASIWGAKAGNGVIVITTKKGVYNKRPTVSFNSNFTVTEKPDLYYQPKMSSADYIEWEQFMFGRGYYNAFLNSVNKTAFTPVVELLFQHSNGLLSEAALTQQLGALKQMDIRSDMECYLYRSGQNQQYAVALSGGNANQKYALSVGLDRNLATAIGDANRRITINANHSYGFFNNKLEIHTGVYYASQLQDRNALNDLTYTNARNTTETIYPYARLTDDAGNPAVVEKKHRLSYASAAVANGLLDWTYNPLNELGFADNATNKTELRLRGGLNYKLLPYLQAELNYLYQSSSTNIRDHYSEATYFTRDLINRYTQVGSGGSLTFPIPRGGILDRRITAMAGHSLRGQLNLSKNMGPGRLDMIAGAELRDHHTETFDQRWYGYNDEYATRVLVDYITGFKSYVNPGTSIRIPANDAQSYLIDRYLSYYTNAAYSLQRKYIISGSARLDQSNLFGVKANQKGVPLWSAGISWIVSAEDFMQHSPFSYLKIRVSYGASGNVNKSISAQTTASFSSSQDALSLLPYATIQNPPNPSLKWERVKILNFGADFETLNKRLSGSLEYFRKQGLDLFSQVPFAPSTGISSFSGNVSATKGHGVDLTLNFAATKGAVKWNINALFSYITDRVTDFKLKYSVSLFLNSGESGVYVAEGKPQFALYSYPFAGLDSENGDPLGYLDGVPSNDWSTIASSITTLDDMQYHGSARPVTFGALRNTISWKGLSFSANISYRLGYYFRRSSVNYAALWVGQLVHGDFTNRWKKPGDEKFTNIPSTPAALNSPRNNFYMNSAALVTKGDHIRLQDIQLSYTLPALKFKDGASRLIDIYMYANNLGILWKANNLTIDPDYPVANFPPQRTLAIGLKMNL